MIVATVRIEGPDAEGSFTVYESEHALNAAKDTPRVALVGNPYSGPGPCDLYLDGHRFGRVIQGPDVRPDLTPYFTDDVEPVDWVRGTRTITMDVHVNRPEPTA